MLTLLRPGPSRRDPEKNGIFTGGPLDVICILKHGERYHPCFFEEKPMPGPVPNVQDTSVVRLKSKMHHTDGFATFEEAQTNAREDLAAQILLPPENLWLDDPQEWDGELGIVMVVDNWRKNPVTTIKQDIVEGGETGVDLRNHEGSVVVEQGRVTGKGTVGVKL